MLIRTEEDRLKRLAEAKEIKVKIPLEFHIKLHTLKVLKGQSISDTVELALGRYFQALTVEMATAGPGVANMESGLLFQPELQHPEMPH